LILFFLLATLGKKEGEKQNGEQPKEGVARLARRNGINEGLERRGVFMP